MKNFGFFLHNLRELNSFRTGLDRNIWSQTSFRNEIKSFPNIFTFIFVSYLYLKKRNTVFSFIFPLYSFGNELKRWFAHSRIKLNKIETNWNSLDFKNFDFLDTFNQQYVCLKKCLEMPRILWLIGIKNQDH